MLNRFDYIEYFTDKEIIKILAHKRALLAKKRHDKHFFKNISISSHSPEKVKSDILKYFPSRNQWIRLAKNERNRSKANTVITNAKQIERTIWRFKNRVKLGEMPKPKWLNELEELLVAIRNEISNRASVNLPSPRIFVVEKSKLKNEYRPICMYDLKEQIVIGQTSKYLTFCFDRLFSNSSYAFRSRNASGLSFNHHKAIADILLFKTQLNEKLYVGECDIRKFYDCVSHTEILRIFNNSVELLKNTFSIKIDSISQNIFYAYLNSFSFNFDVVLNEFKILRKQGIQNGSIPRVEKNLFDEIGVNIDIDKVGVPQGGALSCLIANLLLNEVDKEISKISDDKTFYARFCDDMIVLHPDKEKCIRLFDTYSQAALKVKLLVHQPLGEIRYSSSFWDEKSKFPYKWDANHEEDINTHFNVPWMSFVGYQLRFDGLTRVRKLSLRKELEKQVSETNKLIESIRKSKSTRVYKMAAVFRMQQRLISMAVGRARRYENKLTMCWAAGFNIVREQRNIKSQLVKLDRNRDRQIKRLNNFLVNYPDTNRKTRKPPTKLKYYGFPFSYFKPFKR